MKEDLMKKLLEWASSTENIIEGKLPPLLQEVSNYGFFLTILGIAFMLIGVFGGLRLVLYEKKSENFLPIGIAGGLILFILGLLTTLINCECWLAPRLHFIELLLGRKC